jgi:hypothetical protein
MPFTGDFRDDQRRFQQPAPVPQIGMPRSPQGRVGVQLQPQGPASADELNAFYDRLGVGAGTTGRGVSMGAPAFSPPRPQPQVAPVAPPRPQQSSPWAGYQMSPAVQRYAEMGGGDPVRGSLLDHLDHAMTHFGPGNPYGVGPGYAARIANGLRGYDSGHQAGALQAAQTSRIQAEADSLRDPLKPYRDPYAAYLFGESKNPGSGEAMRQAAVGEQTRAARAAGQSVPVGRDTLPTLLGQPEYAPFAEIARRDEGGQPMLGVRDALSRLRSIGVQGWDNPETEAGQIARELLSGLYGSDLGATIDQELPSTLHNPSASDPATNFFMQLTAPGSGRWFGHDYQAEFDKAMADRELIRRLYSIPR